MPDSVDLHLVLINAYLQIKEKVPGARALAAAKELFPGNAELATFEKSFK